MRKCSAPFPSLFDYLASRAKGEQQTRLRFVLPFGALRFDWAEVLNAQINDETTRLHFSFGYAF